MNSTVPRRLIYTESLLALRGACRHVHGGDTTVSTQQEWDTLGPERSSVRWRPGELPEGLVVTSASLDRLGLHLLPSG